MRHGPLTTQQAIEIAAQNRTRRTALRGRFRETLSIYWNGEGYEADTVDWLMVAIFFNTNDIETFCHGMVTRIYL